MGENDKKENIPEITPEMIEAGVKVLAHEAGVVSEYVAEELAADVFRAMLAAWVPSEPERN
jgi:hypothetical protein